MLYKVTPTLESEPEKKPRDPGAPRKRRATAIYDRDGCFVFSAAVTNYKPMAVLSLALQRGHCTRCTSRCSRNLGR